MLRFSTDNLKYQSEASWHSEHVSVNLIPRCMIDNELSFLPIDIINCIVSYNSLHVPYREYKDEKYTIIDAIIIDKSFKFRIINDVLLISLLGFDKIIQRTCKKRLRNQVIKMSVTNEYSYTHDNKTNTIVLKDDTGVVYREIINNHKWNVMNMIVSMILQSIKKIKVCS